jgi:hypothetical protein
VRLGALDKAATQERTVQLIFAIAEAGLDPFFCGDRLDAAAPYSPGWCGDLSPYSGAFLTL